MADAGISLRPTASPSSRRRARRRISSSEEEDEEDEEAADEEQTIDEEEPVSSPQKHKTAKSKSPKVYSSAITFTITNSQMALFKVYHLATSVSPPLPTPVLVSSNYRL